MKELFKQVIKFVGLSGIGWILDFSVYVVLGLITDNFMLNNILSSWVGVTFVFIFSTRKVFQNNSKISLGLKYLVYIVYQCVLIFVVSKVLEEIAAFIVMNVEISTIISLAPIIAKIIITPITMVLNFFIMKGLIEKL